jgi:hypothetical protein
MRPALVLLMASLLAGCTVNFVKRSTEPEVLRLRVEYFKWLYQQGFYRADPDMMKRAASKLLEIGVREGEAGPSGTEVALEHLVRRLEEELDRLAKEKR